MRSSDFDSTVSILLTGSSGKQMRCSALLERDPGFLKWNRISLIGKHADYLASLTLQGGGEVRWELYNNPDWLDGKAGASQEQICGTATVRSTGMAHGRSVAADSIQKFADLRIFEYHEQVRSGGKQDTFAEFWFLQRPRNWHAYPRRLRMKQELSQRGDWNNVAQTGLKFRLLSIGYIRTDPRISQETEIIHIPGVEIRPLHDLAPDVFLAAATDLWFSLRVLIAFRFRVYPRPLAEFRETPGESLRAWHTIPVESREVEDGHVDPPFYGYVDRFLARGSAALAAHKQNRDLLHAAAFGYAYSYSTPLIETGLTSCVEAIERLVTAFETASSLDREVIDRKDWRKISKALKQTVDGLCLNPNDAALVKRGLSRPVTLSLEDRIVRMAKTQRRRWKAADWELLSGADEMIKARNAIVHGRMIGDVNDVYVELIRARTLFEQLFLNFVNCAGFDRSGYPHIVIAHHRENRARDADADDGVQSEPVGRRE